MEVPHQLQTLLQFLVTDASSVNHLSYILDHLSPSSLTPSPYLQKWITRVTSLMHSKDPAARWAAICIAYRISFLSRSLLIDNAQSWVGTMLSSLSKPEPAPTLRASMRYLSLVLSVTRHNLEFQRQVAIPILPKVSSALLTIAERHSNQDIRVLSVQTLAQLVPLYPSAHKALSQKFFGLCNRVFNDSAYLTTDNLLRATTDLYAILHFLGGKVGGTNLWRKCLDEALQFSWSGWLALRTTFPASAQLGHKAMGYLRSPDGHSLNSILHANTTTDNPLEAVTSNWNKLRCGVSAIGALLRAPVSRPVKLPIGHLVTFCSCLLTSTLDDEGQIHFDPFVRAAESAAVPQIWIEACRLLSCLAETTQGLLAPHSSRLIMFLLSHLENDLAQSQKISFLRCAYDLLHFCPAVGTIIGINRLLKVALSSLSPLYLRPTQRETSSGPAGQPRATKKRRQDYEVVDNVLSSTNIAICETSEGCDILITALDVVAQCMTRAELDSSTRSLANRVLLSILLSLPFIAPSSLSPDSSFQGRVTKKARDICFESVRGTSYAMSKSTSLFLRACVSENLTARDKYYSQVDLLLHPRRPPFVRTLPFVESLSLASKEESAEERATRHSLGLEFGDVQRRSVPSEQQINLDPVGKSSSVLVPQSVMDSLREGARPAFVEPQPQTISSGNDVPVGVATPSALPAVPSPRAMSNVLSGTSLSISEKVPPPTVCAVPMSVDESDHEEVPTIDLGSDSDD